MALLRHHFVRNLGCRRAALLNSKFLSSIGRVKDFTSGDDFSGQCFRGAVGDGLQMWIPANYASVGGHFIDSVVVTDLSTSGSQLLTPNVNQTFAIVGIR